MSKLSIDNNIIIQDIKIRHAQESDRLRWDEFVDGHPNASPYHLYAWTTAVESVYGFKKNNLIAEIGNRLVGVLPSVIMTLPFMKSKIITLPYCDLGGVLAEDEFIEESLIQAGMVEAKKNLADMVEFRGESDHLSGVKSEFHGQSYMDKVRMLLELPGSSDMLWNGFRSKLRSQIRRAVKNGLVFEFANEKIDDFYSVFSKNMRELGSPVHSKKWFEEIIQQYGENAKVGLVYYDHRPVGAGIILRVGKKMSVPWASTLREYNHLSPNMLLYWELLKYSVDSGVVFFDFGRSTPNEGTYRFKVQWGAIPKELFWYRAYFHNSPSVPSETPSRSRQIIRSIWQKMPLSIANIVGPKIRKYISL
jgi:FemAB-related protein (PEP-CTERM system-associated)